MFRLKACYMILPDGTIEARIKSARAVKYLTVKRLISGMALNSQQRIDEFEYQVQKRCRELVRDELYIRYGDKWRSVEQKNRASIEKSITSCIRRSHQISVKG